MQRRLGNDFWQLASIPGFTMHRELTAQTTISEVPTPPFTPTVLPQFRPPLPPPETLFAMAPDTAGYWGGAHWDTWNTQQYRFVPLASIFLLRLRA